MKVYQQGCTPSRMCREGPVPFLFQGPVASGLPWLVAISRQSSRPASSNRSLFHPHIAVSSVYIKTSSDCLLIRTLVLACGAHMDDNPGQCRCIKILHFISSLPDEVIVTGSRVGHRYLSEGHLFNIPHHLCANNSKLHVSSKVPHAPGHVPMKGTRVCHLGFRIIFS